MKNKVLLILCDGMRPDALSASPIATETLKKCPHTLTARTVMPSITLPCHMSLFHSVDPMRHNNVTNTYAPQVRPVKGLIEVLSAAKKNCGFFYNWEELRDLTRPGNLQQSFFVSGHAYGYADAIERTTDAAAAYIDDGDPDLVFLYLGYTDAAGHDSGWMSEEYLEALRASWRCIERINAHLDAGWTVFVTADHGGHDRMHGEDRPEDMTIPLIAWGYGSEKLDLSDVSIKDIAPTIAKLLSVEADPEWEGKCLV